MIAFHSFEDMKEWLNNKCKVIICRRANEESQWAHGRKVFLMFIYFTSMRKWFVSKAVDLVSVNCNAFWSIHDYTIK